MGRRARCVHASVSGCACGSARMGGRVTVRLPLNSRLSVHWGMDTYWDADGGVGACGLDCLGSDVLHRCLFGVGCRLWHGCVTLDDCTRSRAARCLHGAACLVGLVLVRHAAVPTWSRRARMVCARRSQERDCYVTVASGFAITGLLGRIRGLLLTKLLSAESPQTHLRLHDQLNSIDIRRCLPEGCCVEKLNSTSTRHCDSDSCAAPTSQGTKDHRISQKWQSG